MKNIKENKPLIKRIALVFLFIALLLFFSISYFTYTEPVSGTGSHIDGDTVYVNDAEDDYYYYLGMNDVGDINSNTVNYDDTNLKFVTVNYYGYANGATVSNDTSGYVSLTERQNKYVYYKYYPVVNNKIDIELIDNPFTDRPTNKAFGGWTSSNGTITKNTNTNVETLSVNVTSGDLIVNVYTNWIDAYVVYLSGSPGDDDFNGENNDKAVASWGRAFQLIEQNSPNPNDRERNIIVLTGNLSMSMNFTQPVTHEYDTSIIYTDNNTFTDPAIIEYVNGNTHYALVDNNGTIGYVTLSNEVEPADLTKWIITSGANDTYTIQNKDTGRYLSYETVIPNAVLKLSTSAANFKYDTESNRFYMQVPMEYDEYSYTATTNISSGGRYIVSNGDEGNTLGGDLSNENFDDYNFDDSAYWNLERNGNGYTIHKGANYVSIQEGGTVGAQLLMSTASTVWDYDQNNNTLSRELRVRVTRYRFQNDGWANNGNSYYITNGDQNNLIGIANDSNSVVPTTFSTSVQPNNNQYWKFSGDPLNGFTLQNVQTNRYLYCDNSGNLSLSTTARSWRYDQNAHKIYYRRNASQSFYLRYDGTNWVTTTSSGSGTTMYFTTAYPQDDVVSKRFYLANDGENWTVVDTVTPETQIKVMTVGSTHVQSNDKYYLTYNTTDTNFELSKTNDTSVKYATYEIDRQITSTTTGTTTTNNYYTSSTNAAVTVTSLYNHVDYRDDVILNLNTNLNSGHGRILAYNDLQLENLKVTSVGYNAITDSSSTTNFTENATGWNATRYSYLQGNYHNVRIGRGMTPTSWTDNNSSIFCFVFGGSKNNSQGSTTNYSHQFKLVVETGKYSGIMAMRINNDGTSTAYNHYGSMQFVAGNDYDRVTNTNDRMKVYYRMGSSNQTGVNGVPNSKTPAYLMTIKSGNFGYDYFNNNPTVDTRAYSGIYVGGLTVNASNTTRDLSPRVLVVEGGKIANIIGGLRLNSTDTDATTKIYVKNGNIINIVGGAGVSTTYSDRFISVTGGEVEYSVSGGSNGVLATNTSGQNGKLQGETTVHIGGTAIIGTIGSGNLYGVAYGSVLGAGNGNETVDNSGQVDNAKLSISDKAIIYGNVYGGGNYGNVTTDVDIDISGGTIHGNVYGGPNQNGVGTVTINKDYDSQEVKYTNSDTVPSEKTLIVSRNNNIRNAITINNNAITNASLTETNAPTEKSYWLIESSGTGYTLKNTTANRYLSTKSALNKPELDISTTPVVWQYDSNNHSFYRSANYYDSFNVTYSFTQTIPTNTPVIIAASNSNTANTVTGNGSLGNVALSGTTVPKDNVWTIVPYNTGYRIQNVESGQYLATSSSFMSSSLSLNTSGTTWYLNGNKLYASGTFSSYYLRYNSGSWSVTTSSSSATNLYYVTYEINANELTDTFYLGYSNNIWNLTKTNTSVNYLQFTQADISETFAATATNKANGNITINMTGGEIKQTIYGGSCTTGDVAGKVTINIDGGKIGYDSDNGGSIFGGGYGRNTNVTDDISVTIRDSANVNIAGTVYGGSALGTVIGNISVDIEDTASENSIDIKGDMYCGSMGDLNDEITGYITGDCNISVTGGEYSGNVYGGNNENGSNKGNTVVTIGGHNLDTKINSVYGGGNKADSAADSVTVYVKEDSDLEYVYGGGNEANVEITNLYLQGGESEYAFGGSNKSGAKEANVYLQSGAYENIYGGSNTTGIVERTNVNLTGGSVSTIYGGNNVGGSTLDSNILIDGSTVNVCYGGGNLAQTDTTTINVDSGMVSSLYGGGNEASTNQTNISLNGGTITNTYGGGNKAGIVLDTNIELDGATTTNIFGGSNNSGLVPESNITVTSGSSENIYGGNNVDGSTLISNVTINGGRVTNTYGGGKLATTGESNVTVTSGTNSNIYGGGESADITTTTTVNISGGTNTNVFGGSNTLGNVPITNVNISGGTTTSVYGGNNQGGLTEESNVNVTNGNITNIYGGGYKAKTTKTNINFDSESTSRVSSIFGGGNMADADQTNVNLIKGKAQYVYGGSNSSGNIINSSVNVTDGTYTEIYGGNNQGGQTSTTYITYNGGTTSNIYGGGNRAVTSNNTNVKLTGGTVNNIYGGGNNAAVLGSTNVDILNTTITGSAYAGGNGMTATVHRNTNILVEGDTVINNHVFGGGNAAPTGLSTSDNSKGRVNIIGGTIHGNVYGGANTSVLYGETTVNIGKNIVISENTDTKLTRSNNTYTNSEGTITFNNGIINVQNDLFKTVSNYTLIVNTGDNKVTSCSNCKFKQFDDYVIIEPENGLSLTDNSDYDLELTWEIDDINDIVIKDYYTSNVDNPINSDDLVVGDIIIDGTVFGGGEANASGSEDYDYSFISITKGITINIDAKDHDDFDIGGSIFGSGNASSTTGYSNIYIYNYGTEDEIQKNISLQRANLVVLDNCNVIFQGATDRTNEYSQTLFSVSRIDELDLVNDTTLYLENGANLLQKFRSLRDEDTLAWVDIDDSGEIRRNANNRLYMYEDRILNVATNQNITSYGEVDGMTFLGMYTYDRDGNVEIGMYNTDYKEGDEGSVEDVYHFSGGTYVLGLHENSHDTKVDGFYSNFTSNEVEGEERIIHVNYIDPTPEDSSYYMWIIGTTVATYEFDLVASKYSTLGTYELSLVDYAEANTYFSVVGFQYDELDPSISLISPDDIPRIAANSQDADTKFGIMMKPGTEGWLSLGETNFLTDSGTFYEGVTNYYTENSTLAPSFVFYLYHSKNLETDGLLGSVVIKLLAITPINDLEKETTRIDIVINLSRAIYQGDFYEGALKPGREYKLFSSSATRITSKSSFSTYFSLFVDSDKDIYRSGYHHALVSSVLFPVNTKITMIDFASGDNPEYYYYVVNQSDNDVIALEYNLFNNYSYDLSKFIKMGSSSPGNHYDDAVLNDIYYNEDMDIASEEFIFIVDFKEAVIDRDYLDTSLIMELRSDEEQAIYSILGTQFDTLKYNVYKDKDAVIQVDATLSDDIIHIGNKVTLNVETNFVQKKTSNNTILDTTFYDNKPGIKLSFYDENGNQVNGADLMGIAFIYNRETHYPRSDGTIRINLAERVANVASNITIDTSGSNLTGGDYILRVESFFSPDGIYYGITSSDTCDVPFKVMEKNYGLDLTIEDNYRIVEDENSKTLNNTNVFKFNVKYSSILDSPNLRVALFRRTYNEYYDLTYELVNIKDYLVGTFNDTNETYVYRIQNNPNASNDHYYTFKDNLQTGTYRFVVYLYDNNVKVGEVYKYFVIK